MIHPRRLYSLTPWWVLAVALSLTAGATAFAAWSARARDAVRFENAVQSAQDRILGRLAVYLATLRGGAALFAASDSVRPDEFRAWVERIDLERRYPGVQGIGWSLRLAAGLAGEADERHAIRYLEPLDARNRAAIGYDMYGEPVRREAMRRARDTGEPAASGRVILVQEIYGPVQAGFLTYVPVYFGGTVPPTVQARRDSLMGFVYSPFRTDDLFEGIFGSEERPRVAFRVYDGTGTDSAALLHASPAAGNEDARFIRQSTILVAGRPWTVLYESVPGFAAGSIGFLVWGVALAGLLGSLWLFLLARAQAKGRAAAESANQAKSAFLATMSHELRTPLNAIAGYVDLIDAGIAGPVMPQQREYLRRVQHAQRHLLGLIEDVLEFAKLEARQLRFRIDAFDIAHAVDEAASMMEPEMESASIEYRAEGGPRVRACGDAEKVRQILLNLLSNAVKFTSAGGIVRTGWEATNSRVRIRVSDTGTGIPPDRVEGVFEPFVQAESDLTRTRTGTGLGLSISRELARGMSGDLTVDSRVGEGSTFTLDLPVEEPTQPGR